MIRRLLSSPSLRLALFAAIALGAISLTSEFTKQRISRNEAAWEQRWLFKMLEKVKYDNQPYEKLPADLNSTGREPYLARLEGRITALVWPSVAEDGYNGPIKLLVAVSPNGVILGVRVTAHQETAALGDLIEADKSDWSQQFIGRTLKDSFIPRSEGGDFDALTSATITSKAVIEEVGNTLSRQTMWQEDAN